MTVYYIRIDTEKKDIRFKRGLLGAWWIGGIFDLFLLGRDGWPCVDWRMSDVPAKRNERWHATKAPDCEEARKMREQVEKMKEV